MAYHLHILANPEGTATPPATLAELRKNKQQLNDVISNINNIARSAAARILEFHRLFGVSLIDINSLLQLGDRQAA